MATALYRGSFDPIHLGHPSVIESAAEAFDAVRVVVLANPRKSDGIFTRRQRAEIVEEATQSVAVPIDGDG